eukprot:10915080-Alexandrium_andersonii.AAC.1
MTTRSVLQLAMFEELMSAAVGPPRQQLLNTIKNAQQQQQSAVVLKDSLTHVTGAASGSCSGHPPTVGLGRVGS